MNDPERVATEARRRGTTPTRLAMTEPSGLNRSARTALYGTANRAKQGQLFGGVFITTPDDPDARPCPTCGAPTIGSNAGRKPCARCDAIGAEPLELFS